MDKKQSGMDGSLAKPPRRTSFKEQREESAMLLTLLVANAKKCFQTYIFMSVNIGHFISHIATTVFKANSPILVSKNTLNLKT